MPSIRYERRRPEATLLHRVVRTHLETFLAHRSEEDRPVPRFVERELRRFLDCGLLAHGFVRLRCRECGHERLLAFSCKGRGLCPSCGGRRMADHAAHVVDRVLAIVPVRQWVLSLPYPLRFRLAYDPELCSAVLGVFTRALLRDLRRRARQAAPGHEGRSGAVTAIQRFGSALNLNVHFHTLAVDGVFSERPPSDAEPGPSVDFHPLDPPTDEDVQRLVTVIATRIIRLLKRRGLLEHEAPDAPSLLDQLAGASMRLRIATGPRAGRRVMRLGDRIESDSPGALRGPRCAAIAGFSLHANVAVPPRDRERLERLVRYISRPPLATERLTEIDDGRLAYGLRRPWSDGTTHFAFTPLELIEKIVALVPRPRTNLLRYAGVFAPRARLRRPATRFGRDPDGPDPTSTDPPASASLEHASPEVRHRRLDWADLMRRVFRLDVLECPDCQGRLRIIVVGRDPGVIRRILEHLGIDPRPPPLQRPEPYPEPEAART